MEQKKHTDEEILKALECFNTDMCSGEDCPYWRESCGTHMQKDIYDFVYRQKAEIERLQKHNSVMAHKHYIDGIKAFAEELKKHKIKPEFPWDDYYIYESVIDDVAEKMIGGADNEQREITDKR